MGPRRGWALLTVLVLVACFVAVSVDWARVATTQLPVTASRYNTSVNYPREVADAVFKCAKTNGQYGDSGNLQVPVIGTGVFQRVVKIEHDGGTDYAVDPFTGQVYRPLTQLEAHASRCGYAVEEFGTVPAHTLILTYDDGPEQPWTASKGAVPTGAAVPNGAAGSNGAFPNGTVPNGAIPNGTAPSGTASNGSASNGAGSNGAGEAVEPARADRVVSDWEAGTGPIPRVSWEPAEMSWDTEVLRLPGRDSDDADGHANGHPEADVEADAGQPAERG